MRTAPSHTKFSSRLVSQDPVATAQNGYGPADVVLQIVVVALLTQLLGEGVLETLLRVADVGPLSQGAVDADAVVVDLVAASYYDVERRVLVLPQHVVPQSRPAPGVLFGADAEAVAGVELDPHGLGRGGDEEGASARLRLAVEPQPRQRFFFLRF